MKRRDVELDDNVMLICEGLLFSKDDLEQLNERFYAAREKKWKAGAAVNDILDRRDALKRWDEDKQAWVDPYEQEPALSSFYKQLMLWNAQKEEERQIAERPRPNTLSYNSGPFPGIKSHVFIAKEGDVFLKGSLGRKIKVGTWCAEPISDDPVSYRGSN